MAIVDSDLMMTMPKGLTAASGIDALTHALEAYASMMATEFTDGIAFKAMKGIFDYLPAAYENGTTDPVSREKMAHAATMAGMAFANESVHSLEPSLSSYERNSPDVSQCLLRVTATISCHLILILNARRKNKRRAFSIKASDFKSQKLKLAGINM